MAELKTQPTGADVDAFLDSVENDRRRAEGRQVLDLMQRVTGEPPVMWGPSIVGFGRYEYTYESGHSGAFMLTGFSPRKRALTLYIMPGFSEYDELMARLGPHSTGRSCLYVTRLDRIDMDALEALIRRSVEWMRKKYDA